MTAWVIGENCHVIMSHPDIDSGADYGFISPADDSIRAEGAQFKRQVVSESTEVTDTTADTRLWAYFDIILADDLIAPNGAKRTQTRAQDYAKLLQFLAQPSDISLTTVVGTFPSMGSLGWSADERHLPTHSIIKVNLNNVGYYFPPVDPELLKLSMWDGTLTWDTSYWH